MGQILEQLRALWNGMDTTRRWIVIVSLVLVLGLVLLIIRIAGTPKYELLYSRLTDQDKAQIITKLNEMKVPFREATSGGLEVPNAASVRANLLQEGIPNGGSVGWELFDKTSFGATDFTNQINKSRAIAGEIERTLRNFSGIDDAKVLLNMPDNSEYIFQDDKPEGTVSVQLTLREPGILTEGQTNSILNMVRSATGLKADNITIVDNFANDLTAALRSTGQGGFRSGGSQNSAAERFQFTTQYNDEMARKIVSLLSKPFGFKKVFAVVNAELDLDYRETKTQNFADKGTPRSEQEKSSSWQGTNSNSTGVPGTDSNITQYKAPDGGTTNSSGDTHERTTNYEISNQVQTQVDFPGRVKRQSVSVYVDGDLTPAIKDSVYNLARDAAGIVQERGDTLSVETFTLATKPVVKPAPKVPWTTIIIAAILGILLLILIILVIIKEPVPQRVETVKTIKSKPEKVVIEKPAPINISTKTAKAAKQKAALQEMEVEEMPVPIVGTKIDKIIGERAQREVAAGAVPEEVQSIEPILSPEDKARNDHLGAIEKFAREKPSEVAALLKAWLSEE